ncbi:MAG: hypothetical protein EWV41_10200 [Microcystis wesenbergii Mw_MB_S_20031200_S109]|nr:MAG: hypothetical protein EWV41_10200 [Microcystis wesenbergii Mw_MB_S_20031200_S109]
MTENNLNLIRKFLSGEDSPTVKELYLIAVQNAAQSLIEANNNSDYFLSEIQPELINLESVFLAAAKSKLADLLRFDQHSLFRVVELAMHEAVVGNNPKITLQLSPEEKLIPPSENEIKLAVSSQFADDSLVKELLQKNIIKFSLEFGK